MKTIKISSDRVAVVDLEYFWRPLESCPASAKVQLLTTGGVAVYGHYSQGQKGYLGWAPLPKRPDWMR